MLITANLFLNCQRVHSKVIEIKIIYYANQILKERYKTAIKSGYKNYFYNFCQIIILKKKTTLT